MLLLGGHRQRQRQRHRRMKLQDILAWEDKVWLFIQSIRRMGSILVHQIRTCNKSTDMSALLEDQRCLHHLVPGMLLFRLGLMLSGVEPVIKDHGTHMQRHPPLFLVLPTPVVWDIHMLLLLLWDHRLRNTLLPERHRTTPQQRCQLLR